MNKLNINLPFEVELALNILESNGFEAYVVGGCVRDSLLGYLPEDWDITTSALPKEIKECFRNKKIIETGLKHGTVTVLINKMPIEITTYRIDGEYRDNRRPESVEFTRDLSLDLERRDFTINAMAYNKEGLVDIFEGIKDLSLKQIRCVGNPDTRFNEDGLRILRALRFASVLNFNIEKNTSVSLHKNKNLLKNISSERIIVELNKLVMGDNFFQIMADYKDVFEVFIEELGDVGHDAWIKILKAMTFTPKQLILRLSLFYSHLNNIEEILKKLKYDNYSIKTIKILCKYLHIDLIPNPIYIKRLLNKLGYDIFKQLLDLKKALVKLKSESLSEINALLEIERIGKKIIEEKQCYSLKDLEINGQDIIDLGFKRGRLIGEILDEVLDKVIKGELENKKDMLLNYIKNKNI